MRRLHGAAGALVVMTLVSPAKAQTAAPPDPLALRSLAATCAACHGTDGQAVAGAGMTSLRGLDRTYLQTQLSAFRDGTRPATVMHQIAKGYTPEQLAQLAGYFAGLPRVAP
jgi:cytochrome subunit of sulfide dehydrogenase